MRFGFASHAEVVTRLYGTDATGLLCCTIILVALIVLYWVLWKI